MTRIKKKSVESELSKSTKENLQRLFSNGIWVYKTFFRMAPRDTLFLILIPILQAIVPTVTAYFGARFLDEIIALVRSGNKNLWELTIASPIFLILLILTASRMLNSFLNSANRYINHRFRVYHLRRKQQELSQKISTLDVQQFEDSQTANALLKARDNFYKIQVFMNGSLEFMAKVASVLVAASISFTISPVISLIIIFLSVPSNIVYSRFIKKLWDYYNRSVEENRRRGYLLQDATYELNIPEHKVVGSHLLLNKLADELGKTLFTRELSAYTYRFKKGTLASLFSDLVGYLLTPFYLLNLVIFGQITIGQFTFYQGRFLDLASEIDWLAAIFLEAIDSSSYLSYVRNIFELKPVVADGALLVDTSRPPLIEFQNVSFRYPGSRKFVLRNINLKIKPKEEIAIVGENGAGKTTLIKLLLRFYEPTEGIILINGIAANKFSLESYYQLLGTLFQDYNRYLALDVKNNIAIGDSLSALNLEKVRAAAKSADANKFIDALENRYDQLVARQFSGGTNLSTGQWQKLALARMFYRNRPILILDEPTASIDAQAEFRIFRKIYNFIKNKTVIVISHRFSTVRNAHQIYVLERGRLIESGNHEQLMKKNGKYAKAFSLQAKGYRLA